MPRASDEPDWDRDEFARFYAATEAALRAYARRCVSDSSLADDLVQESYVRLMTSSKAALPHTERKLYLFRITSNLLRDHWTRSRRFQPWPDTEEVQPTLQRSRQSSAMDVTRALENLSPKHRSILWLAYVEEYDHHEIATAMNMSRLSVRVVLFRARKRMAEFMEGKA